MIKRFQLVRTNILIKWFTSTHVFRTDRLNIFLNAFTLLITNSISWLMKINQFGLTLLLFMDNFSDEFLWFIIFAFKNSIDINTYLSPSWVSQRFTIYQLRSFSIVNLFNRFYFSFLLVKLFLHYWIEHWIYACACIQQSPLKLIMDFLLSLLLTAW